MGEGREREREREREGKKKPKITNIKEEELPDLRFMNLWGWRVGWVGHGVS